MSEPSEFLAKAYDGEGGVCQATADGLRDLGPFPSIGAAREAIWRHVGGDFGSWEPPEECQSEGSTGEAWHDSEAEGCGGYEIIER